MERIQTLVVGAGVVGLAVARELARSGREVVLVERHEQFGAETSSRNSEVIHAGIYYPEGSLKAQLCVEGKADLYRYCLEHGVAHRRCGKLIVATNESQHAYLESLQQKAIKNGVDDLQFLTQREVVSLERGLSVRSALLSPSTGIVDSHSFMLQLLSDFERYGGIFVKASEVSLQSVESNRFEFFVSSDQGKGDSFLAHEFVNCAGLHACQLLNGVRGYDPSLLPKLTYAKGCYFSYQGKHDFDHLVYPVPEDGGLGIHLTLDLQGQARFGPNVEWLSCTEPDDLNYEVSGDLNEAFYQAIRLYWPGVEKESLIADYAGVRPKLSRPGEPAADFMLQSPSDHRTPGLVNLFGIESPGLTASLALAKRVRSLLTIQ